MEGLTKEELSDRVRISYDQLVNIECARVTLKWWIGQTICRALNVSQLWMATGGIPMRPFFDIPAANAFLPADAPFSAMCLEKLREDLETYRDLLVKSGDRFALRASQDSIVRIIAETVKGLLLHVRWENRLPFLQQVTAALHNIVMQLEMESEKRAYAAERKLLTIITAERNTGGMTEIQELINRVARAARLPGKKTELANALGVPTPRVSEWLRKDNPIVPSGETTLRLLRWVEQQERQQNTPGSATNTAKGKTQVRKSQNEKQTQVLKKE